MNTLEIRAKYLRKHDKLGPRKQVVDKDTYDAVHGQVWADMDYDLKLRYLELEINTTRTPDDNLELFELRLQFRDEIEPQLKSQSVIIAELLARIEALEGK